MEAKLAIHSNSRYFGFLNGFVVKHALSYHHDVLPALPLFKICLTVRAQELSFPCSAMSCSGDPALLSRAEDWRVRVVFRFYEFV